MDKTFAFEVNGRQRSVTTDPERPLLDVLREDLRITGPRFGCGEGFCGACTVLLNGQHTHSCITPVSLVAGQSITTIEGLATGERLHPVQAAFLAENAFQCGYCTSGMILTTVSLLKTKPDPTDAEIIDWMNGNLCRCCGFTRILKAVHRAAAAMKG